MRGKRQITWVHFACDRHEVVVANDAAAESLLLGSVVCDLLTAAERSLVYKIFGQDAQDDGALKGPKARPCPTVGMVRRRLNAVKDVLGWLSAACMDQREVQLALEGKDDLTICCGDKLAPRRSRPKSEQPKALMPDLCLY